MNTINDFVRAQTIEIVTGLVPEIHLHLARDSHRIFEATRRLQQDCTEAASYPPYWAFAWPGGQAMARHILDTPTLARGQRIADIGSGSGIAAIAAARAGATRVMAVDVDPLAVAAIALNSKRNGVDGTVEISGEDCLADLLPVDLVLISDLVYEPELAVRVGAFVERCLASGIPVIVGDRMSARCPARGFTEITRYEAPLTPALCDEDTEHGRIWYARASRRETRRADRAKLPR